MLFLKIQKQIEHFFQIIDCMLYYIFFPVYYKELALSLLATIFLLLFNRL